MLALSRVRSINDNLDLHRAVTEEIDRTVINVVRGLKVDATTVRAVIRGDLDYSSMDQEIISNLEEAVDAEIVRMVRKLSASQGADEETLLDLFRELA